MLAPLSVVSPALALLTIGAVAHAAAPSSSGAAHWTAHGTSHSIFITHDVRHYGAACDGITVDTVAIDTALSALSIGDTLLFPPHATCVIDDGLTASNLTNVTIDGRGATILATGTMSAGKHMLKFRYSTDLVIQDLTIDANATTREAHSLSVGGPARDAIAGGGSTLMFYGAEGLDVVDVDLLDSWHDGLYLDKGVGIHNSDVWVEGLAASGAGRNAFTVIDCTDCVFVDMFLADAVAGTFDIEPYDSTQVVNNVYLLDSVVKAAGAQCIHATNSAPSASQIEDLTIAGNAISECHLLGKGGYGAAIVLTDVEQVVIEGNSFEDIDLRGASGSADSRSVIDLFLARNVVIRSNLFDNIRYDPAVSSVFYFWNDTLGYQATHTITQNDLMSVPSGSGWCWVATGSPYRTVVEGRVFDNRILGATQSPNPGCY
ncbi:MAG: hypothetical protein CL927_00895 [Deltaproteobacteria bacterium]|nr:hypothetical protein [Deltaproteobacteria bacterium]